MFDFGDQGSSKKKKRAVRDIIGRVDHYTNTKTVGLRNPVTGKIEKRISRAESESRGISGRTFTLGDEISKKKRKFGIF